MVLRKIFCETFIWSFDQKKKPILKALKSNQRASYVALNYYSLWWYLVPFNVPVFKINPSVAR